MIPGVTKERICRSADKSSKLKMKPLDFTIRESANLAEFIRDDGSLICSTTKPQSRNWQDVDVAIGPYAKLDELANVIAFLAGGVLSR